MIKTLNSPYQWRHKMTDETGINQDDEAKLINVLSLDHSFKNDSYTILINTASFAVKHDKNADYQLYASLDELAVAEYMPEIYQSVFYGLLMRCYCMKLFNAPQAIAFAEIFEEQMIDLCVDGKQTEFISEVNRISHYLIRKIKRKASLENVDWSLANQPISYEIKTRSYLTNNRTMVEK